MGPSAGQPAIPRRWAALSAVCVGVTLTTLDLGMVTLGFPAMGAALGADLSLVVWVGIGYFLVSAGLLFFMGWLGDMLGRRTIYMVGMGVVAVGLGLCALATGIFQLIGFRMVEAVGVAMVQANATAIVVEAFPQGERGWALGILGGVQGAGLAGGPRPGATCWRPWAGPPCSISVSPWPWRREPWPGPPCRRGAGQCARSAPISPAPFACSWASAACCWR